MGIVTKDFLSSKIFAMHDKNYAHLLDEPKMIFLIRLLSLRLV